jgi:phosphatidate cytidylyltransferase
VSNLAQRVAVAVVAIPLIYLLCMTGGLYFFTLVAALSAVALHEFYMLAARKGARPLVATGLVCGLLVNLTFLRIPWLPTLPLAVIVPLVVLVLSVGELFHNQGSAVLNLSTSIFGVFYVALFFGTLIGIRELFEPDAIAVAGGFTPTLHQPEQVYRWGGAMVMTVFATIWICDSAAFHVGSAFGAHKLFPRVSPNKSWEGAIAGLLAAILTALVARWLVLPFLPLSGALLVGVTAGTIGQIGDLVESLLKRDAGVKDSSALIPGHGGMFDRFDSVLLVAPCIYLYLAFVLFRA